jgi:hypothetical protein
MLGGVIGIVFFAKALLHSPPPLKEKDEPPAHSAPATATEHGTTKS